MKYKVIINIFQESVIKTALYKKLIITQTLEISS